MTLFAQLNGAPVTKARVVIPYSGIWHADVWMDRVADTTGIQSLEVNGLTLSCSVVRQVDFSGESSLRLVGGAGGWRTQATPKLYSGANLSTIIGDTATSVGEQAKITQDKTVSPFYVVVSEDTLGNPMPASQVLQDLLGDAWYMDSSGVIQQGLRPSPPIVSSFTLRTVDGPPGVYQVDTDTIADWMPGASFSGPTGSGIISRVTHVLDAGKLHTEVMVPSTASTDRLRVAFEAMLRAYLPGLLFCSEWQYTVVAVNGGPNVTIDANSVDPRMPNVAGVPLRPSAGGATAIPPVGAQVIIGFANGDPRNAEVRSLDPNTSPSTVFLGGSGPGVARLGDTVLVYFPPMCPISGTLSGAPFVGTLTIPAPGIGSVQTASAIVQSP